MAANMCIGVGKQAGVPFSGLASQTRMHRLDLTGHGFTAMKFGILISRTYYGDILNFGVVVSRRMIPPSMVQHFSLVVAVSSA